MWKKVLLVLGGCLILTGLSTTMGNAQEIKNDRRTARIHSIGHVLARPDVATLVLTIETEAPKAQEAAQENARRAEKFLSVMKNALTGEESVQSMSYGVSPIYTYPKREEPSKITGYRARHCFRVKLKNVNRIGEIIDLGLQNEVTSMRGPYWEYSRLEELTREAALQALAQARRLAEALAQAEHLKVKRLYQVSTEVSGRPSPMPRQAIAYAEKAAPKTPIEVGEEEICARIQAIYELE
ncbi:MAG: SIMPL domain-containing protein [Deltaproteobacteria bacterium]|nr:SIMPL domain-containing protein [Deltaproteobacteria bacterium]MBW1952678.1 SIMPL domain-containing protein [Deltaproteobacteria bacterium]MBW1985782.1 SIMPL domain-containing protein [Deltaproteobacteria bacterium]MBW2133900.1 SIMPL domain-containing protein [Deltaproteobacteria bacterium]